MSRIFTLLEPDAIEQELSAHRSWLARASHQDRTINSTAYPIQWDHRRAELSLPGFTLSGAYITHSDLQQSDFTDARGKYFQIESTYLNGACFNRVCFGPKVSLWKDDLEGADLTDSRFIEVDLREARMVSANLSDTRWAHCNLGWSVLDQARAIHAQWKDVQATECSAIGIYFRGAELVQVSWLGADLRNADFRGAVLRAVDLQGADCRGADFRGAILQGVDFRRCQLAGADFRGADLREVHLHEVDLSGSVLTGAELPKAINTSAVNQWENP